MSTPAIIITILQGLNLLLSANRHGKEQSPENFWTTALGIITMCYLLWWGGFYDHQ